MKIKIKLLSSLIFFLIYIYLAFPSLSTKDKINNEINKDVFVQVSTTTSIFNIELEEYLIGVVAAEMPASFEDEALKAQAVASRTFVYSRNLKVDDTTQTQAYQNDDKLKAKWKDDYEQNLSKIKKAVNDTKGQVIVYEGQIIHAFFFSSSNGQTNNSEDYWTTSYPYLKSVDSHYDEIKKDNQRTKIYTLNEINTLFNMEIKTFKIISNYDNGYVKKVKVNEKEYSGKEIREKCNLSSSSFKIMMNENTITFETIGSGHGVGMSQYGAQGMALQGYDYVDIIQHYYQGVEIVNK
ncbi:MAG: stage II sporulation protein D [Traorella sp.]